ncbi:hypothetical protein V8V91_08460 [Algoriphagus halophilus]|uniref:hypothetical protein n=1 Tax=Algoriphagus halophilus TaxID=226505 RepID=UPI0035900EE3
MLTVLKINLQVYFLSSMGLNQNIGVPSNLPGVETPFKGDFEKLVRSWAKGTATQLFDNAQKPSTPEIRFSIPLMTMESPSSFQPI